MTHSVVFSALPRTLEQLKALPQAALRTPEDTAALTVAALCAYPESPEACFAMLDYLRGPRPLSQMEKQFIRDRFMDGVDYVPRSYFNGATPQNDYAPSAPYTLELADSASPIAEEGYRKLDIRSGGADTPRSVTLRGKPSTGEWFLWEHTLLAQIRKPVSRDEWA
ncbi:MAG: hypothetical protein IKN53_05440 [Oscillibacter sp.]|nr:hypothetical protein [Oscillibacter sp.]